MRETSSFPLFLYYISLSVSFFSPLFFFHFFSIRYFRFILSYYAFLNEGTLSLHRSTRGIFHPSRRFSFICKNEFILKLEKKCHSYHYLTQLVTFSSTAIGTTTTTISNVREHTVIRMHTLLVPLHEDRSILVYYVHRDKRLQLLSPFPPWLEYLRCSNEGCEDTCGYARPLYTLYSSNIVLQD